jgi:DMSO/TMAO reductase YedYZ heme-binding membrane subunit
MISFIVFGLLGYRYARWIHKHQYVLYGIAGALMVLGLVFGIEPLVAGDLSIGFFMIVMFAGALPQQSSLSKRWRSIRKEYSIIGFILATSHAVYYIFEGPLEWVGIAVFIMMIPLTIISFDQVRKKMSAKTWKTIQKLAYVIYLGLWIHVIVIGEFVFTVPFAVYVVMKAKFEWEKSKRKKTRLALRSS